MGRTMGWRRVGAAVGVALAMSAGAARAGQAEDAAKLKQLLSATGLPYKDTTSPSVVTMAYTGKSLANFRVIAAAQDSLIVVFTNPMKKGSFAETVPSLYKMARLNHELDSVKVEIDDDGDLAVRIDMPINAGPDQFKSAVAQVAAATDEVYKAMIPYQTTGK